MSYLVVNATLLYLCGVKHIFILFVLLIYLQSYAQPGKADCHITITGQVIDEHNNEPLEYASIFITELDRGVVSDSLGNFELLHLCPGKYTLVCRHLGCDDIIDIINVKSDTSINFYPEHHIDLLEAVEIRTEGIRNQYQQQELQVDGFESTGKSLSEQLQSISGLSSLNTGTTIQKPVLNGLHSQRLPIIQNSVSFATQAWGQEHAPEIDLNTAKTIEVYTVVTGIHYDHTTIAGAIHLDRDVFNQKANTLSSRVGMQAYSNGRGIALNGSLQGNGLLPGLYYNLIASGIVSGDRSAPDYILSNTGNREYNGSYQFGYQFNSKHQVSVSYAQYNADIAILSASHIGNLTDLELAFNAEEPAIQRPFDYNIRKPYQHLEHETVSLQYDVQIQPHISLKTVLNRQVNIRKEYDVDELGSSNSNQPDLNLQLLTYTGYTQLIWKNNYLKFDESALKFKLEGNIGDNRTLSRYLIPSYMENSLGFSIFQSLKKNDLLIEGSARFDHEFIQARPKVRNQFFDTTYSFSQVSGGVLFKLDQKWDKTIELSSTWRRPSVNELFSAGVHHGAATYEEGNPNLSIERNFRSAITLTNSNFRAEISGIYFLNFIQQLPTGTTLTIRGAFPALTYNQFPAFLLNANLMGEYVLSETWNQTAFFRAELPLSRNLDANQAIPFQPLAQISVQYGLTIPIWNQFELSIRNELEYNHSPFVSESSFDFIEEPNAFFLINSRITTEFGEQQQYQFGLEITNLLNQSYRNYMNRYRYFVDEVGRNIKLTIGITL